MILAENTYNDLKQALTWAWEGRNLAIEMGVDSDTPFNRMNNSREYFLGVDPEDMLSLKYVWNNMRDGSFSMLSLSQKIRKTNYSTFMKKYA